MRIATPEDRSLVVNILAESFETNQSVNAVVKQDGKRRARIRGLMEYAFDTCARHDGDWLSKDNTAALLFRRPHD